MQPAPAKLPVMPQGLSPEAQQAFLHGVSGAQAWINTNSKQLQEQHAQQVAAAKAAADRKRAQDAEAARWAGLAALEQAKEVASKMKPPWGEIVETLENVWAITTETLTKVLEDTKQAGIALLDSGKSVATDFCFKA